MQLAILITPDLWGGANVNHTTDITKLKDMLRLWNKTDILPP